MSCCVYILSKRQELCRKRVNAASMHDVINSRQIKVYNKESDNIIYKATRVARLQSGTKCGSTVFERPRRKWWRHASNRAHGFTRRSRASARPTFQNTTASIPEHPCDQDLIATEVAFCTSPKTPPQDPMNHSLGICTALRSSPQATTAHPHNRPCRHHDSPAPSSPPSPAAPGAHHTSHGKHTPTTRTTTHSLRPSRPQKPRSYPQHTPTCPRMASQSTPSSSARATPGISTPRRTYSRAAPSSSSTTTS